MVKSAKLQLTGCQIFKSGEGQRFGMVDFDLGTQFLTFTGKYINLGAYRVIGGNIGVQICHSKGVNH